MNTEKVTIDSNILCYAYRDENLTKQERALELLVEKKPYVSHFVLFEFLHQLHKNSGNKKSNENYREHSKLPKKETIRLLIKLIEEGLRVMPISPDIYHKSNFLINRNDFQLADSLIVADSVLNGCTVLYTEDMCTGMIIDEKMKIVNPFL
ncbi:MAG: PIN domain-containing protein [Niabella sp.]